jgi:transposase
MIGKDHLGQVATHFVADHSHRHWTGFFLGPTKRSLVVGCGHRYFRTLRNSQNCRSEHWPEVRFGSFSDLRAALTDVRLTLESTSALCWAHARRQFFELADIAANARRGKNAAAISPVALQAVRRIDALFDIERGINGLAADERMRIRKEQSAPLLIELEAWLREERARLSRSASVAKPIDYMLKRWDRFARFIDDGRICLTNNAAERALRGFALGRKSWLFAGSERGADRAAAMATLIMTAKLNDVDPQAWLADVLARIAGIPQSQLHELLPWMWKTEPAGAVA